MFAQSSESKMAINLTSQFHIRLNLHVNFNNIPGRFVFFFLLCAFCKWYIQWMYFIINNIQIEIHYFYYYYNYIKDLIYIFLSIDRSVCFCCTYTTIVHNNIIIIMKIDYLLTCSLFYLKHFNKFKTCKKWNETNLMGIWICIKLLKRYINNVSLILYIIFFFQFSFYKLFGFIWFI